MMMHCIEMKENVLTEACLMPYCDGVKYWAHGADV